MTEAMPFLHKTILLSYDPRSFGGGLLRGEKKGGSGFLWVPCGTARGCALRARKRPAIARRLAGLPHPLKPPHLLPVSHYHAPWSRPYARLLAGGAQTPLCNGR